jgi:hypothetical protein
METICLDFSNQTNKISFVFSSFDSLSCIINVYIFYLYFNNRKDIIKTKNITAALIRKVDAPIVL